MSTAAPGKDDEKLAPDPVALRPAAIQSKPPSVTPTSVIAFSTSLPTASIRTPAKSYLLSSANPGVSFADLVKHDVHKTPAKLEVKKTVSTSTAPVRLSPGGPSGSTTPSRPDMKVEVKSIPHSVPLSLSSTSLTVASSTSPVNPRSAHRLIAPAPFLSRQQSTSQTSIISASATNVIHGKTVTIVTTPVTSSVLYTPAVVGLQSPGTKISVGRTYIADAKGSIATVTVSSGVLSERGNPMLVSVSQLACASGASAVGGVKGSAVVASIAAPNVQMLRPSIGTVVQGLPAGITVQHAQLHRARLPSPVETVRISTSVGVPKLTTGLAQLAEFHRGSVGSLSAPIQLTVMPPRLGSEPMIRPVNVAAVGSTLIGTIAKPIQLTQTFLQQTQHLQSGEKIIYRPVTPTTAIHQIQAMAAPASSSITTVSVASGPAAHQTPLQLVTPSPTMPTAIAISGAVRSKVIAPTVFTVPNATYTQAPPTVSIVASARHALPMTPGLQPTSVAIAHPIIVRTSSGGNTAIHGTSIPVAKVYPQALAPMSIAVSGRPLAVTPGCVAISDHHQGEVQPGVHVVSSGTPSAMIVSTGGHHMRSVTAVPVVSISSGPSSSDYSDHGSAVKPVFTTQPTYTLPTAYFYDPYAGHPTALTVHSYPRDHQLAPASVAVVASSTGAPIEMIRPSVQLQPAHTYIPRASPGYRTVGGTHASAGVVLARTIQPISTTTSLAPLALTSQPLLIAPTPPTASTIGQLNPLIVAVDSAARGLGPMSLGRPLPPLSVAGRGAVVTSTLTIKQPQPQSYTVVKSVPVSSELQPPAPIDSASNPNTSPRPSILRKRPGDSANTTPIKKPFLSANSVFASASSVSNIAKELSLIPPVSLSKHSLSNMAGPSSSGNTVLFSSIATAAPPSPHHAFESSNSSTASTLSAIASPYPPSDNSSDKLDLVGGITVKREAPDVADDMSNASGQSESSPRKKPRKQQLLGRGDVPPLRDPEPDSDAVVFMEEPFIPGRSHIGAAGGMQTRHTERGGKRQDVSPVKQEPIVERIDADGVRWVVDKQRSQITLLNSYRHTWKSRNNHFLRYTDIKVKEDRQPTVNDLANQKSILQKVNGWKFYHMCAQMEDLSECEELSHARLSDFLECVESLAVKSCGEREANKISELVKGNLQRTQLLQDQMKDSATQLIKLLEHKSNIVEIVQKYVSKRTIKTKKKISD